MTLMPGRWGVFCLHWGAVRGLEHGEKGNVTGVALGVVTLGSRKQSGGLESRRGWGFDRAG